ncbi:hypothetical protein ABPG75_011747 [Micractinium tetrahymenae]
MHRKPLSGSASANSGSPGHTNAFKPYFDVFDADAPAEDAPAEGSASGADVFGPDTHPGANQPPRPPSDQQPGAAGTAAAAAVQHGGSEGQAAGDAAAVARLRAAFAEVQTTLAGRDEAAKARVLQDKIAPAVLSLAGGPDGAATVMRALMAASCGLGQAGYAGAMPAFISAGGLLHPVVGWLSSVCDSPAVIINGGDPMTVCAAAAVNAAQLAPAAAAGEEAAPAAAAFTDLEGLLGGISEEMSAAEGAAPVAAASTEPGLLGGISEHGSGTDAEGEAASEAASEEEGSDAEAEAASQAASEGEGSEPARLDGDNGGTLSRSLRNEMAFGISGLRPFKGTY